MRLILLSKKFLYLYNIIYIEGVSPKETFMSFRVFEKL